MSQEMKRTGTAPVAPKPPGKLRTFLDSDIVYSWQRQPVVIVATLITLVMFAGALFAPWIAPQNPFDPRQLELIDAFSAPLTTSDFTGNFYLLGSDSQGRDVFSAILYGSRISPVPCSRPGSRPRTPSIRASWS